MTEKLELPVIEKKPELIDGAKGIITLSGMSGSGKTTVERLLTGVMANMGRVISHTTRAPRPNEVIEGPERAYYFSTDEEFDALTKIEYTEFNGFRYCVAEHEIFRLVGEGFDVVVIVCDYNGVPHVYDWCQKNNFWYLPCYFDVPLYACATRIIERSPVGDQEILPALRRIGHLVDEYSLFNRLRSEFEMLEIVNTRGPRNCVSIILGVVKEILWHNQVKF